MERRLRAIDALLDWSDVLHERQGETPWKREDAVELAERLHEGAVTSAFSHVSDIGESVSDMISEETK